MVLQQFGALRFAGLFADFGNLPLDVNLLGATFDAVDTIQKYVFDGTAWNEFVSGSGEANLGANVGVGTGLVFRDKTGVTLNFKSLIGGSNITVTDNADDITISSTGTSPLTTKGDLYGFSTVDDRIPVGTDGQVLNSDPLAPFGVKWVDLVFTKGQLLSFSTIPTQLGVGTDNQILSVDLAEPTGLKWIDSNSSLDPTFDTVTFNLTTPAPSDPTNQSIEWFETLDANNDVKHIKMKIDGSVKDVRYF